MQLSRREPVGTSFYHRDGMSAIRRAAIVNEKVSITVDYDRLSGEFCTVSYDIPPMKSTVVGSFDPLTWHSYVTELNRKGFKADRWGTQGIGHSLTCRKSNPAAEVKVLRKPFFWLHAALKWGRGRSNLAVPSCWRAGCSSWRAWWLAVVGWWER